MRRILIIDDAEDLRHVLFKVLTEMGNDVVVAENGEEGIELLNTFPIFDLVLTDVRMPGTDGNAVARYVRTSSKPDTPIVAITAVPDEVEKDVFDASISKPFKIEVLKELIRSFD